MGFEFDPDKDASNRQKHGLALSQAEQVEILAVEDDRSDYGEDRYLAFGRLAERGVCLVFTHRGDQVRVVSLRPAREKEMRRHVPIG